MKKVAQNPISSFNETVPSTDVGMQASETQGLAQPDKTAVMTPGTDQYAAVPNGYDPNQQPMDQQQSGAPPEMIQAAQSFLGPEVMQAAMQGDPAAADLIARTAAHVGNTFMNSLNQPPAMAGGVEAGAQGMPGAPGAMPTPVGITSPEEDLAAELVPAAPAPAPAQPGMPQGQPHGQSQGQPQGQPQEQPAEQPGQNSGAQSSEENASGQDVAMQQSQQQIPGQQDGTTETVDLETVRKLIALVKSGQV